jgi:hypothetical protein
MTDMPAFYPNELIEEIKGRQQKGVNIHTLVLWTKHPQKLLDEPLHSFLLGLHGVQLFVELTITGMAGVVVGMDHEEKAIIVEPNVPKVEEALAILPKIIELVGKPARILLRIDPIFRIKDIHGKVYTNLPSFKPILTAAATLGIDHFTFSFLEKGMHRKVDARFEKRGLTILSPKETERLKMLEWINKLATEHRVTISACCVPGLPPSACIDGKLLEDLHDRHLPLGHKQPKSRLLCGCTESIDLGGWPPKKCYSGCLYCYGSPCFP